MINYSIKVAGTDGSSLTGTLTHVPGISLRLGVDCKDGDLQTDLAVYPRMAYHRVFSSGALPRHDGLKLSTLPESCIPHVSWKSWSEGALEEWLAGVRRPMYLTYHHEPMGDIDPALYQLRAARAAELAAAQPFILGTGPILTRFWLEEGNGNPLLWWFTGAAFWGVDAYAGTNPTRYRTPEEMFQTAVGLGEQFNVPVLIPEWGQERLTSDTTGQLRAQSLRDSVRYLKENQVTAAAWWNIDAERRHRLTSDPELSTLRTLVDMQ